MIISTEEEYNNTKNKTIFEFYCRECGKLCNLRKYNYLKKSQIKFLCKVHKIKATCQEVYGVDNYSQTSECKQKVQKTCQEKYGSNSPLECPEIYQKTKETLKEHYGTDCTFNSNVIQEKIKDTIKRKYGVDNPLQSQEIRTKIQSTCLEKYGAKTPLESEEILNKTRETCLTHLGVHIPFMSSSIKEKADDTKRALYGTIAVNKKYLYNNTSFDSSWELAFYIYCIDHNIQVKRNPCILQYTVEKKTYNYEVDFSIPCGLIEIKGDHFFSNGVLINPYDKSIESQEKALAKYNCMLNNNVNILKHSDLMFVFNYISNNYGKNYLSQFKKKV